MHNTYIAVVLFATIYVVTTSAIGRSDGRDGGDNRALECEVLDGITGQVMSPGFESGVYPARTRQCWKIIVEESETLNLHFEEFELEDSERCRFDYLKIEPQYDVEDGPEMFSGKLCGQEKPEGPFTYTGSYNEIVLLFYSDAAEELLGFHLIWTISSETQGVDTRLIGGDSNTNIGIVQLNHNGNWLAVSDERFDEREADIACRSIGFTGDKNYAIWDAARAFLDEPPPASVSTLLKVDRCSSSENSLTNCVEEESFTLAGVVCNAEYGGVRLVGGATAGRVEVNIGGVWGSVCDERWGEEDARVVCRELDLEGGNDEDISTYEQGIGVVWYSGVRCRGTEATLSACRMEDRPGENRCAHSRDVAVSCRQPTTPAPTTTPPTTTTAATSQGCTLLRGSGTVETEHPYAVDFTQCWTLYVPDGLVQLTFLSFEVERNSRCGWDSLEIYYGTDIEGEPEHKLCGDADDIASSYRSTGEYMTLNFISDYRDTEEGFVARFSGVDAPSNNGVDCGVPSVTPIDPGSFIVGGHEANPHSHPWIVNFIYDGHVICGGSILSERYVITAAHCVYNENRPDRVMVRVGNHHIDDDEQYEQVYAISDITVHQGWTGSYRRGYDLAVLKTEMPIVFNDHVMPVCLPEVEESVAGTVTVSGWGNTEGTGDNDVLNEVFVPVVPHATCSQDTWYGSTLQDNQICAGFERGQRDSCQGDSGGPLTQIADGVTKLYGLTSWGIGCAERRRPGVYTKVADFVDWIEDVTDGDVRPY